VRTIAYPDTNSHTIPNTNTNTNTNTDTASANTASAFFVRVLHRTLGCSSHLPT
jgi:hypothetical protein